MLQIFFLLFVYVYVCLSVYVHVPEEVRAGQILWSWSYRQVWAVWCGCWKLTLSALQEHYILLTAGPSLQHTPPPVNFKNFIFIWLLQVFVVFFRSQKKPTFVVFSSVLSLCVSEHMNPTSPHSLSGWKWAENNSGLLVCPASDLCYIPGGGAFCGFCPGASGVSWLLPSTSCLSPPRGQSCVCHRSESSLQGTRPRSVSAYKSLLPSKP